MLEYIILGFLMGCGDMSGYDIKQQMSHSTANFYDASYGSIYPMLKKMEESGAILVRETVEGGKYKKLYSITDAGRAQFLQWLESPIELHRAGHDHLVRLFFFGFLEKEKARKLVTDFIATLASALEGLYELGKMLEGHADKYQMATLDYGIEHYKFVIRWCGDFLEKLKD